MSGIEHPEPSAIPTRDDVRRLVRTVFQEGYQHRRAQWAATRIAGGPAVTFNPDACRAWLDCGAADQHGIDDNVNTIDLTIPPVLEALLAALSDDSQPQVWRLHPTLRCVQIWRTADDDGVDGGAIITADLSVAGERVRLASLYQGVDDFTADTDTTGINAAVEALGHVADLVNAEFAAYRSTAAAPDGYTVIGDWESELPIPLAVVELAGPDAATAVAPQHGWWIVDVVADNPDDAAQAAIVAMRTTATS